MPATLSEHVQQVAHDFSAALRPIIAVNSAEAHFDPEFVQSVHAAMQTALGALATTNCWGTHNRLPSSEFWNIAGNPLLLGTLQKHARTKPHGYAGDYEMLQMICEDQRHGTGLAWAFDDFFQRQAAPLAVRNRATLVAERLAAALSVANTNRKPFRIVSVGSGPAADLERFGRLHPQLASRAHVSLLDLDPRALHYAHEKIGTYFPNDHVQSHRVNLKRLPRLPEMQSVLNEADFIFCAGFFDYLDRADAVTMLGALWSAVGQGGQLLIFNFSDHNPSRAYMEWMGNWYLTYRTAEQLTSIGAAQIARECFSVDVEPAGVNLFLHARKTADS